MPPPRRDSYSEMSAVPQSQYDPVEWLRAADSVEGDHAEIQREIEAGSLRVLSVRQKRNIAKKLTDAKENIAKMERAIYKWEENPMKFRM